MSSRSDPEKPVLVVTTGGTIDKVYFDALSSYQVGDSQIARLLALARVTHPFQVVELMRKDSLELDDGDRDRIYAAVAGAETPYIVVTHGTDTMTTTARRLAFPDKTVVLVGSLSPARFSESDAAFNLGMAFAAAQIAAAGVYITMNGTVFDADRVVKDRDRGAFISS